MIGSCLLSKPSGRAEELGGGVEVWFGHFQSLRLGWQPFLNVDATQRAFLKSGKVHLIMADMTRSRVGETLNDRDYMDFSKKIATLKVNGFFPPFSVRISSRQISFGFSVRSPTPVVSTWQLLAVTDLKVLPTRRNLNAMVEWLQYSSTLKTS